MAIRVLLADDHAIVRDRLKAVMRAGAPEIRVLGEAGNGRELLRLAARRPAHVYVIDVAMPLVNGIEATDRLLRARPESRVVLLSEHDVQGLVEKAFRFGARGYLLKEEAAQELVTAVRKVHEGGFYLSPRLGAQVLERVLIRQQPRGAKHPVANLTPREQETLRLIAEGYASKEIAERMHIAVDTVQVHRKNLMRKLDIHRQTELVRYALREGIASL